MTQINKRLSLIAVFLLLGSLSAEAQMDDPCTTQSSTMEVNACAEKQYREQDQLLNPAYEAVLKVIAATNSPGVSGDSPRQLLIRSQRKWIEFRDADCKAQEKVYQSGTVRTAIYLGCLRNRTEQRIKELKIIEWQGG